MILCSDLGFRRILATALIVGSAIASAAPGFAASEELKCQDAIAVSARNYFKDRFSAVSKCEGARISGKIDAATDCRPGTVTDSATAAKLDKAASKLSGKITGKCSDAVVDIDRFNYATVDVTTSNATVTYRDNTGGILTSFVIAAE